eukprot:515423-Amphidinium_carterae.1
MEARCCFPLLQWSCTTTPPHSLEAFEPDVAQVSDIERSGLMMAAWLGHRNKENRFKVAVTRCWERQPTNTGFSPFMRLQRFHHSIAEEMCGACHKRHHCRYNFCCKNHTVPENFQGLQGVIAGNPRLNLALLGQPEGLKNIRGDLNLLEV